MPNFLELDLSMKPKEKLKFNKKKLTKFDIAKVIYKKLHMYSYHLFAVIVPAYIGCAFAFAAQKTTNKHKNF